MQRELVVSNYQNYDEDKNVNVLKQGTDDLLPGVFFYTMPEEIEADARDNDLKIIQNTGISFTLNAGNNNSGRS